MPVDVHAHVVPPSWLTAAAEGGPVAAERRGDGWVIDAGGGELVVPPGLVDTPGRLAAMDSAGIRTQVLSAWVELGGDDLADVEAARHAALFNDHVAELVAAHPERFDGLGIVAAADPVRAAAEVDRIVGELGLAGIELLTTAGGRELDDPDLDPLWAAAARRRAVVLLHPYRSRGRERLSRHRLTDAIANPTETAAAVAHLLAGGVLARHPDLRLCLVHGGGTLVALAGRLDAIVGEIAGRLPSDWLRDVHVDSLTHSPGVLATVIDLVGADRVVIGSDHPFDAHGGVGEPRPLDRLAAVRALTPAQRSAIASGNARRLLAEVRRDTPLEAAPIGGAGSRGPGGASRRCPRRP